VNIRNVLYRNTFMNQNTYMCIKSNITVHALSKSVSHSHQHTQYLQCTFSTMSHLSRDSNTNGTSKSLHFTKPNKQVPIVPQSQQTNCNLLEQATMSFTLNLCGEYPPLHIPDTTYTTACSTTYTIYPISHQ
jgi:hypothetical protein